jgi:hypothetical protein
VYKAVGFVSYQTPAGAVHARGECLASFVVISGLLRLEAAFRGRRDG